MWKHRFTFKPCTLTTLVEFKASETRGFKYHQIVSRWQFCIILIPNAGNNPDLAKQVLGLSEVQKVCQPFSPLKYQSSAGWGGDRGTRRRSLQVPDTVVKRGDGVPQGSDLGIPLSHRLHQVAVGLLRLS